MNNLILVFGFFLFSGLQTYGHESCALGDMVQESSLKEDTPQDLQFAEDNRWLYEIIIPENLRLALPDESFKSFRVHLKDTYKYFPHPDFLKKNNLKDRPDVSEIVGKITYVGIIKKMYRMELLKNKNKFLFTVRIYLKNPNKNDKDQFQNKLNDAQRLWNESKLKLDFDYSFKFEIVNDESLAHFSVNVLDETRGPYDTNWGRDWTPRVLAHEVGHMLGLADEYQTLSGQFDCLRSSLMCTAWSGDHMLHHHYFILRRLVKDELF